METNKRETRVFNSIFWKRFKDTKKSSLVDHIIQATQTDDYLLADFFSQENGIDKLLAEVDNPLSELDPNRLMEIIYQNILSKKIVIERRSIQEILSMIIVRERVSPELKEICISALWNTYATDDEYKEHFVDLLTQAKLTPDLLNRLLCHHRMNGLIDFLNSTSASFDKNYRDVLLKPYVTEHLHEPQRITALLETTILDDLLEQDELFSWLTPASLAVLYEFSKETGSFKNKFRDIILKHMQSDLLKPDIKKHVLSDIHILADILSDFDLDRFTVWIDLMVKSQPRQDKMHLIFSTIDACFSILTPEQKTQMVQNFLNTLSPAQCFTLLSESPPLCEIALNGPIEPLLGFISDPRLFNGVTTQEARSYWKKWTETTVWGGREEHRELIGDGTLDKIKITNRQNRDSKERKRQTDLFCDRLLNTVLDSKIDYRSFTHWLNNVGSPYRNKVVDEFLKKNPRLALNIFYTTRLSGDRLLILQFLINTWETLPQQSDNTLDKEFILKLLATESPHFDGAHEALSALIAQCQGFMEQFITYLQNNSIGTLSAPDSYFFFIKHLNPVASDAFLNTLFASNPKEILSLMMRPENLVHCKSMSTSYNIIGRYILETWPNLTMNTSSSAVSGIDQSFILSCLTAPDAYQDEQSTTYLATLLKNLIHSTPSFSDMLVHELKRRHTDFKQVLLKIIDQETSPMAKNVMCKKFILLLNEHEDKDAILAFIHKMDLKALFEPNALSDDEISNTLNLIHPYLDASKKQEVLQNFHEHETKRNYTDHPITSENFSWTWLIYMYELPRLQQQKDFKPSPILLNLINKQDKNHFFDQLIAIRKNSALRDFAKESSIENIYQWIRSHKTYNKYLSNTSIRTQQYSLHHLASQDGPPALDPNFLPIPIAEPKKAGGYFSRVTAAVAVPVNEAIDLGVVDESPSPTAPPVEAMPLKPSETPVAEASAPPVPKKGWGLSFLASKKKDKKDEEGKELNGPSAK